jgi:hypothetical protein
MARLETEDAAVPRRNAYAPSDVRADAERGTVRGEERTLAARGTACGVRGRPRVARAAPERVRALESEQRLRHVRLPDDDGACCAQRRDELLIGDGTTDGNDRMVSLLGSGEGERTTASRSAGLLAHCVYPIVLSKPLTLTRNHPRDIPLVVSIYPKYARPLQEKGRGEKGDTHKSLRLIGTPCNGPFKWPLSENSASSLRASSVASPKNTTKFVSKCQRPPHYNNDKASSTVVATSNARTYVPSVKQFDACCACAARAM